MPNKEATMSSTESMIEKTDELFKEEADFSVEKEAEELNGTSPKGMGNSRPSRPNKEANMSPTENKIVKTSNPCKKEADFSVKKETEKLNGTSPKGMGNPRPSVPNKEATMSPTEKKSGKHVKSGEASSHAGR